MVKARVITRLEATHRNAAKRSLASMAVRLWNANLQE
jgi:hypothetical protein